jgi:geranylgeranyl reductase family protein
MMEFDVIIIGAGPAGSLTAYLLSRKGFRVGVFDRNAFPVKGKVCGEYLCPAGFDLLKELKIENVLDGYPKIIGMNLFSPNQQKVDTKFPNNKFGHGLKREKFDNDLVRLAQQAGAQFHFGVNIDSLDFKSDSVLVNGNNKQWKSSILVGADGRQSIVGKWIGLQKKIYPKRVAIHAYLKVINGKTSSQGEMHIFADGSYCGINPVDEKFWNFSIVCDASKIKKYSSIQTLVEDAIHKSERLSSIFDLSGSEYKVVGKITNSVTKLGCVNKKTVLIGDAGGFVDPLTGEGIYHALLTAKIFSESLSNYQNFSTALGMYEKRIKKDYHKKEVINYFFQWLIRKTFLCNFVAHFLKSRPAARDAFIGLVGNIHSPLKTGFIIIKSIFNKKGGYSHVDHH